MRENPALRRLIRETVWDAGKLVAPLFVAEGIRKREAISSMPGVFRLTGAEAVAEASSMKPRVEIFFGSGMAQYSRRKFLWAFFRAFFADGSSRSFDVGGFAWRKGNFIYPS